MKLLYSLLLIFFALSVSAQELQQPKSVNTTEIPDLKLYPNPAYDNYIYITTSQKVIKKVVIYDVFGKVVLRDQVNETALDISHLDSGIYVLYVVEGEKSTTRKLVIK